MTRDDDRERISAVGQTNRTDGVKIVDPPRQFAIRDRSAVGDLLQLTPDAALKRRAAECIAIHRQIKRFAATGKVVGQLRTRLFKKSIVAPPTEVVVCLWTMTIFLHEEARQPTLGA